MEKTLKSVKFNLIFEISDLNYPSILVLIACDSKFGGLQGHCGLQMASMASVVKFYFIFEINNLNYPGIPVHNIYNSLFGGL